MNDGLGALPPAWFAAAALPVVLLDAWLCATIARFLLRGRAKLRTDTSIVIAILSMAVGLFVAGLIDRTAHLGSLLVIACSLAATTVGIAIYGAVSAHFQRPIRADLNELLAGGESGRVEYKSTARVNLHTGSKDPKMEQIIAKTVNGFLNGDGGTLLIGVDDKGVALGLEPDFATLKSPDADRFELWLRDLLTVTQGQNAAAMVKAEFPTATDAEGRDVVVCRLDCRPSPFPVYLKNKDQVPEMWVRNGNSTRRLAVDEATEYVMHRWPLGPGASIAAQFRSAARFSAVR